jgi:hypothetical protein
MANDFSDEKREREARLLGSSSEISFQDFSKII